MIDGLVVVDKAAGWTSHDVVAKCRGVFGQKRVGHSGTLDPDATGVLLVGLGRATRLLRFLTDLPKSYVGEVVFGTETSTLDAAGEVTATHDMAGLDPFQVAAVLSRFTGPIEQVPPMVSAVKVGGRRLHELAREGIEVPRQARPVTVHRLAVEPTADPLVYGIEVDCSSGTYIRTLAADLGHALGGGAHLRGLRRTAIGSFTLDQAAWLDDLRVLGPAEAMRDYPSITVEEESVKDGRILDVDLAGPTAVLAASDGRLLAVYEPHGPGRSKPAVVLAPA
ncbi:MAG TPA: tRNA pseudouridine(55) synthase TruB [Acidimicrobiales bacterium]|nr:tRNA pseudouridine(55) synthase TruB [Acidimicrobiales bacterium]